MSYPKKARMSLHAAVNVLVNDDSEWFDSEADEDDELDFSELADPLTIAQDHAEHITGEKIQIAIQLQTCKFIVGLAIYTHISEPGHEQEVASSHPIIATPEMTDHEPTDQSNCTCMVPVPEIYTNPIIVTSETECTHPIVPTPEMTEEMETTATPLPQRPPVADNSSSESTIPTSSPRAMPFNPGPFEQAVGATKILPSDALPMDFFNLVFGEETYQLIADETNRYKAESSWRRIPLG